MGSCRPSREPRTSFLDALWGHLNRSDAERSCDRGEGGAFAVLVDDQLKYAWHLLAPRERGPQIVTVKGLWRL